MILLKKCPACQSSKIIQYGNKRLIKRNEPKDLIDAEDQFLLDRLGRTFLTRYIYFCRSCTFIFQNPTFDDHDLKNIYDVKRRGTLHYYKKIQTAEDSFVQESLVRRNQKKRQERYAKVILTYKGTKILDYGGNIGENLTHHLLKDTERYVYDFGRDRTARTGITLIKDLNAEMNFDFIIHTHVLEHEPEPIVTLRNLRRVIAPGGVLYLEVPFEYVERILTRRPGAVWHLNYFNRRSLMEIAVRAGWKCESIAVINLPYSSLLTNCLVTIMRPYIKEPSYNNYDQYIWMTFDFLKLIKNRIIHK